MSVTDVLLIAAVALFGISGRTVYYRQVFGRWVIRLRPDERKRLLPADNRAAYIKGYEDARRRFEPPAPLPSSSKQPAQQREGDG